MGFDMMPWKLEICKDNKQICRSEKRLIIDPQDIPEAPEPGRLPAGEYHLHVAARHSGDQRNPREEAKWRTLLLSTARCEHGRMFRDPCGSCLYGVAPDISGKLIGYTVYGQEVRIPTRDKARDPEAWIAKG